MRRIRLFALGIVSFFAVLMSALLAPGTIVNRALSAALCTIFSFNSTVCTVNLAQSGDRVVAATPPAVERNISDWLVRDPGEFDDAPSVRPGSNPQAPPFPQDPGPNQPLRPDFDNPGSGQPARSEFERGVQSATDDAINEAEDKLFDPCNRPEFARLLSENYPPEVIESLKRNGSRIQSPREGIGGTIQRRQVNYDEFRQRVRTPQHLPPESVFKEMLNDMNSVGRGEGAKTFNDLAGFQPANKVGDILKLRLGSGPIDLIEHGGDVVVTEINRSNQNEQYFRVATINTPSYTSIPSIPPPPSGGTPPPPGVETVRRADSHPVNGQREFGFKRNPDGTVDFYTRAADRWHDDLARTGAGKQSELWKNFMRGLQQRIKEEGGEVIGDFSEKHYKTPGLPNCSAAREALGMIEGKVIGNASSWGDPHLTSFDGQKYDHHAIGEFVLTRSKDKRFEVQVREAPYGSSSSLGINIAAAMRVGNDRVAIYSQDFPDNNTQDPLRVNGKTISGEKQNLSGGGFVAHTGSGSYLVQWPSGEQVTVKIFNKLVEVTPGVTEGDRGQLEGLLGNFNGNPSDDFMTRDGRVIAENKEAMNIARSVLSNFNVSRWIPIPLDPLTEAFLDSIHRQFGDSWRVSQTESLFDYPAGKNTDSFTKKSFPNGFVILRMLAPQAVQLAEETCRKAEVPNERLEGCLFDVAASGDVSLASVAANILKNEVKQRVEQEIRNRVPIPIPLPF